MNILRRRDLGFGLFSFAAGIFLFVESFGMTFPSKTFPLGVSACIIVLGALILGKALMFPAAYEGKEAAEAPSRNTVLMMISALIYVSLIPVLGFYTSSFLCIIVMSLLNTHDGASARSVVMTILSGVIFLGLVYLMFSYILQSTIPKGMFI